jgi:hypothetical protein
MLELASSRWLDLVQTLMDWTDQHCRASHRRMRRRTPLCRDGGICRAYGVQPLRFLQRHQIMLDHLVSGSGLTKRASGVSSGILVHQDY